MPLEHVAFDFVERCSRHRSASALLDDLLSCIKNFGYEYLILSGVPIANQKLEPLVELNGWPVGWFDRYTSRAYEKVDGVCLNSARSISPFYWADVPPAFRETTASKAVANEATEFNIASGYAVPMQSRRHWQSVVSMASPIKNHRVSQRELAAITMMAGFAASSVEAMRFPVPIQPLLTNREREVLQWWAAGKSAWEIGEILGLAESTVQRHTERIRAKYRVATTRQAVIEGIRTREIFP
jgi:LuxR family transcriptional regulator, quorum-sensing system regulator BjaR1